MSRSIQKQVSNSDGYSIPLKCKKFGVAKVKISDLRTLLYKWIPPPQGGGVYLKNLRLKRFWIQILRLKEKGGKTLSFLITARRRRKFLGISGSKSLENPLKSSFPTVYDTQNRKNFRLRRAASSRLPNVKHSVFLGLLRISRQLTKESGYPPPRVGGSLWKILDLSLGDPEFLRLKPYDCLTSP